MGIINSLDDVKIDEGDRTSMQLFLTSCFVYCS